MAEERLSVSKTLESGLTKEVNVKKVENGYITRVSKHGDVDGEWVSEEKEYISTTNPLEKKKEKSHSDEASEILKILDNYEI